MQKCPSCGAGLSGGESRCPYCGAMLPLNQETFRAAAEAFVRGIDADIRQYLPASSMVVAALGCVAAAGVYLGARHLGWGTAFAWVLVGVVVFFGLGAAGMIASRAERRYVLREVFPRIRRFAKEHGMTTEEFVRLATEILGSSRNGLAPYLDDMFQP